MLRLAITGGLCSGKSTVSHFFRAHGCPVADAYALGHTILQGEARQEVLAALGDGILAPGGAIDAARVAALVFVPGGEAALARLNAILHPRIMAAAAAQLRAWEREGNWLAGVEAALLIEAGLLAGFDHVLLVVADVELRIARFTARSGGTRAQAEARLARQWPDARKRSYADLVIANNGSMAELNLQLEAVLARLRAEVTL
jgi:dephospho-CoA kinase